MGGVFAALAVVIMNLGGLIPVATYVGPTVCMVLLSAVNLTCGSRIGWAWYGAVSLLSLLMSPDKEAAAVFTFIGYYPLLKPKFETSKLKLLWKLLLFNGTMVLLYSILIRIMGVEAVMGEENVGKLMLVVLLLLGNVLFLFLDRTLTNFERKLRGKR